MPIRAVPAADTSDPARWAVVPPGASRLRVSRAEAKAPGNEPALRLEYRHGQSAAGAFACTTCRLPADAVGLRIRYRKASGEPAANLLLRLLESDGDSHTVLLTHSGRERSAGRWHAPFVPLSRFQFEPRGDGRKSFRSVNRLQVGVFHAPGTFEIAAIRFLLLPPVAAVRSAGPSEGEALRVAVLHAPSFPRQGAPTPAEAFEGLLGKAGKSQGENINIVLLAPWELAQKEDLPYDVLVVPTGPVFPVFLTGHLRAFLRHGGSLLLCGGYAFDRPVLPLEDGSFATCSNLTWAAEWDARLWPERQEAERRAPRSINTRYGRVGDTLGLAPEQLGLFDPSDRLTGAVRLTGPLGDFTGPVSGWSAVGLIGTNNPVFPRVHATWRVLLTAQDRYGRDVGPAGALLRHFGGPFKGGVWAFFGVDNRDLFSEGAISPANLCRLLRSLAARTFPFTFLPEHYCFRPGEKVAVSVRVGNFGRQSTTATLSVGSPVKASFARPSAGGTFTATHRRELTLKSGEVKHLSFSFPPPGGEGFYRIEARFCLEPGRKYLPAEKLTTGFCVWDPQGAVEGPALSFRLNRFFLNGVPRFLTGTNQTGVVWYSSHEEPFRWYRDFTLLRESALTVVRFLHFSPFACPDPTAPGRNDPRNLSRSPPESLVRKTDALVYLLARCNLVPWLSLHDWQPVVLSEQDLAAQHTWARFWAARYRGVRGMLWDIQNEPTVHLRPSPLLQTLWQQYTASLPGAIGESFPRVEQVLTSESRQWTDPAAALRERFRIWLFRRWTEANLKGLKEGNPAALCTVGLLPTNAPIDKALAPHGLDFASFHFYGRLCDFPLQAVWADRSCAGQGLALGEFGAQEAHNARVRGLSEDRSHQTVRRYVFTVVTTVGLGGALACSWDMRDLPETVFPWGMARSDNRPKMALYALRALSFLFRTLELQARRPDVLIVLPDSCRLSAGKEAIDQAVSETIRLFLHLPVSFGLATEEDLLSGRAGQRWPSVRLWPLPHVAGEEALKAVYKKLQKESALLFGSPTTTMRFRIPTSQGDLVASANCTARAHNETARGQIAWTVPPLWAFLLHLNREGAPLGLVAGGGIFSGEDLVMDLPLPTVLFSLTKEPLSESDAVLAIPLGKGSLRLRRSSERGGDFAVGEIRNGTFVTYERGTMDREGDVLSLPVDRERVGCLILVGKKSAFPAAEEKLWRGTHFKE